MTDNVEPLPVLETNRGRAVAFARRWLLPETGQQLVLMWFAATLPASIGLVTSVVWGAAAGRSSPVVLIAVGAVICGWNVLAVKMLARRERAAEGSTTEFYFFAGLIVVSVMFAAGPASELRTDVERLGRSSLFSALDLASLVGAAVSFYLKWRLMRFGDRSGSADARAEVDPGTLALERQPQPVAPTVGPTVGPNVGTVGGAVGGPVLLRYARPTRDPGNTAWQLAILYACSRLVEAGRHAIYALIVAESGRSSLNFEWLPSLVYALAAVPLLAAGCFALGMTRSWNAGRWVAITGVVAALMTHGMAALRAIEVFVASWDLKSGVSCLDAIGALCSRAWFPWALAWLVRPGSVLSPEEPASVGAAKNILDPNHQENPRQFR